MFTGAFPPENIIDHARRRLSTGEQCESMSTDAFPSVNTHFVRCELLFSTCTKGIIAQDKPFVNTEYEKIYYFQLFCEQTRGFFAKIPQIAQKFSPK